MQLRDRRAHAVGPAHGRLVSRACAAARATSDRGTARAPRSAGARVRRFREPRARSRAPAQPARHRRNTFEARTMRSASSAHKSTRKHRERAVRERRQDHELEVMIARDWTGPAETPALKLPVGKTRTGLHDRRRILLSSSAASRRSSRRRFWLALEARAQIVLTLVGQRPPASHPRRACPPSAPSLRAELASALHPPTALSASSPGTACSHRLGGRCLPPTAGHPRRRVGPRCSASCGYTASRKLRAANGNPTTASTTSAPANTARTKVQTFRAVRRAAALPLRAARSTRVGASGS